MKENDIKLEDILLRIIDNDQKLRVFAAETTELVEAARKTHHLSPVATAALGRTLTAGAMMGVMLKNSRDKLTIQIKGEGPLGGIVISSNSKAKVKGYVYNPEVYLPPNQYEKLDVGGAVGKNGYMNVIKDLGLKEPYIGYVPLVSGEIGEDLSLYFLKSEQTPAIVAVGVLVEKTGEVIASGGFIVQVMPKAEDAIIEKLENNLKQLKSLTTYLAEGTRIKEIVEKVTGNTKMQVLDTIKPEYICDCSRERMEKAIITLGEEELNNILESQGKVEIECHFCLNKYTFIRDDIEEIFSH